MNLHAQIMNLPALLNVHQDEHPISAYKHGHRDARHAAAELALKADAEREELLSALTLTRGQWIHSVNAPYCLAVIARATGETP